MDMFASAKFFLIMAVGTGYEKLFLIAFNFYGYYGFID